MDFISAKAIIKCENFFYFIFIWPICIHNSLFSWCCCRCCSSSHSFSCVPFVIDNSFWNRSLAHKMCHCLCCCWCVCAGKGFLLVGWFCAEAKSNHRSSPLCAPFFRGPENNSKLLFSNFTFYERQTLNQRTLSKTIMKVQWNIITARLYVSMRCFSLVFVESLCNVMNPFIPLTLCMKMKFTLNVCT